MDAVCCLPYLQAHSLGIHSASKIDFSCPLFKLPPIPPSLLPQLQRERGFVEVHPSNQWNHFCSFLIGFINLFCHSCLFQSWQALPEFMNLGVNEPKGLRSPILNWTVVCLSLIFINNFRRITELWKGPAHCWIATSVPGINHFKNLTQKWAKIEQKMYTYFSNLFAYSSIY